MPLERVASFLVMPQSVGALLRAVNWGATLPVGCHCLALRLCKQPIACCLLGIRCAADSDIRLQLPAITFEVPVDRHRACEQQDAAVWQTRRNVGRGVTSTRLAEASCGRATPEGQCHRFTGTAGFWTDKHRYRWSGVPQGVRRRIQRHGCAPIQQHHAGLDAPSLALRASDKCADHLPMLWIRGKQRRYSHQHGPHVSALVLPKIHDPAAAIPLIFLSELRLQLTRERQPLPIQNLRGFHRVLHERRDGNPADGIGFIGALGPSAGGRCLSLWTMQRFGACYTLHSSNVTRHLRSADPAAVVACAAGDQLVQDLVGFCGSVGLMYLLARGRPVDLVAVEGALFQELQDGFAYVRPCGRTGRSGSDCCEYASCC